MTAAMFFGPGPAALPRRVLDEAREAVRELDGTGLSILEHSHRGAAYGEVHDEALVLLRDVLDVPPSHEILLLQGGARAQFAIAPMNLRRPGESADYVLTGTWSEQALAEAERTGRARIAGTTRDSEATPAYTRVPRPEELDLDPDAAYLHLTTNNTLFGTQFHTLPEPPPGVPLVADATSDLAGRRLDLSRFGVIYAAAQKNLGIAGLTVVLVARDLLDRAPESVPTIFRYRTAADARSLQNTIPTFPVFVLRSLLRWMQDQGGLDLLEARNREKAATLYAALDAHRDFYRLPAEATSRSIANVVFFLPTAELGDRFLAEAAARGMTGLKGHRAVGGLRASLYNAVEAGWVDALRELVTDFARRHG